MSILPDDTKTALETMISLTKEALAAYENETNAMALGSGVDFLETTQAKQSTSVTYQKAAQEFLARQEEFKSHGGPLLQELLEAQKALGACARTNMAILEPVVEKLQDNHKSSVSK